MSSVAVRKEVVGCSHAPVLCFSVQDVEDAGVKALSTALTSIRIIFFITIPNRQPSYMLLRIVSCKWQLINEQTEYSLQLIKVKLVVITKEE